MGQLPILPQPKGNRWRFLKYGAIRFHFVCEAVVGPPFFSRERERKVSQSWPIVHLRKPVVPHHLCLRRDVVAAPWRLSTKQKLGESLCRTASQHRAPSSQPCCGHAASEEFWDCLRLGLGQGGEELGSFGRPSASTHIAGVL